MELKDFLLSLLVIFVFARVMGELAARLGQSPVLGELLAGVVIGGSLLGWVHENEILKLLGQIGVILLLFEIGLESDLPSFLRVGRSATLVAVIGVIVPFVLGYAVALLFHLTQLQAVFIGATLTATSVAISARSLADLGKLNSVEGNMILGAAVLDDILGLITLSVIIGLATAGTVSWAEVGRTFGLALLFLVASIAAGSHYAHLFSRLVNLTRTRGALVIAALSFALLFAYAAELVQMAPFIGAFAAGLILARTDHHAHIQVAIKPVADVFIPVFFVLIGATVDLQHLNPLERRNWPILLLAGGLTVVALIGKLAAGFGAIGPRVNRWVVGVGMIPRGEVGVIFATMGLAHHVLDKAQYGAILLVVMLTTLLSPILLKRVFKRD